MHQLAFKFRLNKEEPDRNPAPFNFIQYPMKNLLQSNSREFIITYTFLYISCIIRLFLLDPTFMAVNRKRVKSKLNTKDVNS